MSTNVSAEEFAAYFGSSDQARLDVLNMLMETVPVGVWYTNESGEVIYVNAGWERTTHSTFADVKCRAYRDSIHPEDVANVESELQKALESQSCFEVTFRLRGKDGEYRWFYSRARWSAKHNGFPAGLVGITVDVTKTQKLTVEGQMLWRCVDQVRNPIIITDPTQDDNPIIFVNDAFIRQTGYTPADAIGKNPRFLHAGDDDQPVLGLINTAVGCGVPISNVVVRNYRKNGDLFFAELHLSPVVIDGRLTYWIGIQVVVTDKVKSQEIEELRAVVQQLTTGVHAHSA